MANIFCREGKTEADNGLVFSYLGTESPFLGNYSISQWQLV